MTEIKIDYSQLKELDKEIGKIPEKMKPIKKAALDSLGTKMLAAVKNAAGDRPTVHSWQHVHVGEGGGYAAVHPAENQTYRNTKAVSFGYITNAVDTGHGIRKPSGKAESYRARIRVGRVQGLKFYAAAESQIQNDIKAMEQKLIAGLDDIIKGLP